MMEKKEEGVGNTNGKGGNMGMETWAGNDDDEVVMLRYIWEEHVYDRFFFFAR